MEFKAWSLFVLKTTKQLLSEQATSRSFTKTEWMNWFGITTDRVQLAVKEGIAPRAFARKSKPQATGTCRLPNSPYAWWPLTSWFHQASNSKIKLVNFSLSWIPKEQTCKENPRHVQTVLHIQMMWIILCKRGLVVNFWAYDVIMHKAYSATVTPKRSLLISKNSFIACLGREKHYHHSIFKIK